MTDLTHSKEQKDKIVKRLTALWAFSEAGMGGVLHAFQVPFKGLFLTGMAVILIALIYRYSKDWKEVMKALGVVLIIKAAVAPHTPILAYLAVSFQGIVGAGLFSLMGINTVSIFMVSCLGLLETATQRLFTLWLLFGRSLREALVAFGDKVKELLPIFSEVATLTIPMTIYFGIYIFSAFILTTVCLRILRRSYKVDSSQFVGTAYDYGTEKKYKKNGRYKRWLVLGMLALVIALQQYYNGGWYDSLLVVSRVVLLLIIWFAMIGPFLSKTFLGWLRKRSWVNPSRVEEVFSFFPHLKAIAKLQWQISSERTGLSRLYHFLEGMIFHCLVFEEIPDPNEVQKAK